MRRRSATIRRLGSHLTIKANGRHFATTEIPRLRATRDDHAGRELHKIYTLERVSLEAPLSVGVTSPLSE